MSFFRAALLYVMSGALFGCGFSGVAGVVAPLLGGAGLCGLGYTLRARGRRSAGGAFLGGLVFALAAAIVDARYLIHAVGMYAGGDQFIAFVIWAIGVGLYALGPAVAAMSFVIGLRIGRVSGFVFAIGAWIGIEWLRQRWVPGFNYLSPAYLFCSGPFRGLVGALGYWGCLALAVSLPFGAAAWGRGQEALRTDRKAVAAFVLVLIVVFELVNLLGAGNRPRETSGAVSIAIGSEGGRTVGTGDPGKAWNEAISRIEGRVRSGRADVTVFPEGYFPATYEQLPDSHMERLSAAARENQTVIIAGANRYGGVNRAKAVALVIEPEGHIRAVPKSMGMPIGEYVPSWLAWLLPRGSVGSGGDVSEESLPLKTSLDSSVIVVRGIRFAIVQCYEMLDPGLVAARAFNADAIVVLANTAWDRSGRAGEDYQRILRQRAWENRLPVFVAMLGGESGFVDGRSGQEDYFAANDAARVYRLVRGGVAVREGHGEATGIGGMAVMGWGFAICIFAALMHLRWRWRARVIGAPR